MSLFGLAPSGTYTATATYHVPQGSAFSPATTYTYPVAIVFQDLHGAITTRVEAGQRADIIIGIAETPTFHLITDSVATSRSASPTTSSTTSSLATEASASQTSEIPATGCQKTKNVGLYAAIGVLAAFLSLSLAGLGFLLFRRKKQARLKPNSNARKRGEDSHLQHHSEPEGHHKQLLTAAVCYRGPDDDSLSEREVLQLFDQLENSITTWVHTYFKDVPAGREPSRELATLVPNYELLLKQRRTQFLVIRAVVAHVLTEGFRTAEFLGGAYRRLREVLEEKATSEEFSNWRVQSISLLEGTPNWTNERNAAITSLTNRITSLLSPLTTPGPNPERLTLLHQLITAASQLAIDLTKQHARYEVSDSFESGERGAVLFEPNIMEDVLQENKTEIGLGGALVNRLKGNQVRVVVFPLIVRWGEAGKSTVISKAKVLA
ncbi:MAG: hypothetical protein M1813_002155 [Trichoglossum hirsutum]|nr:MAG: hypothetical protein M1813_002155 [Trichoglossum hirsutum]